MMNEQAFFLELLQKMVSIPSVSGDEENLARFLADFLRQELHMETELVQVKEKQYNLIARKKRSRTGGKKLLLGGHMDTVDAGGNWSHDPFVLSVEGTRAYGRGTCDMKGGLAAQITGLKRLQEENIEFCGEIELLCVCDEEQLSLGANHYVKQAASQRKADFAIFAEPHFDNLIVGAAGKTLLEIEIEGKTGHAAEPANGINAVDCMAAWITEVNQKYSSLYREGACASHCFLRAYSEYSGYSLNIPDKSYALLNKHLDVQEQEEAFLADLAAIYRDKIGVGHIQIRQALPHYPSYRLDLNNEDYQTLYHLIRDTYGIDAEEKIGKGVTDGNVIYPSLGIPIVMFGPKGVNLHQPDEYLDLDSVWIYIDILHDFIKKFFAV